MIPYKFNIQTILDVNFNSDLGLSQLNLQIEKFMYSIEKYAPVAIPTLCRYDHFIKCISSLEKCKYASKTDVFVAVDYPLKQQHWNGYSKICNYLSNLDTKHHFKSLTIIKRPYNYGLGENGNLANLVNYILESYDNIIISEDDNVFSLGFLEYINNGLYKYRGDNSVLAVCGYKQPYNFEFGKSTFSFQDFDFSAWGYGIWKEQLEETMNLDRMWFYNEFSLSKFVKFIQKFGKAKAIDFLSYSLRNNKKILVIDNVLSIYMPLSCKKVVFPYVSQVLNLGFDGSGEHFKTNITQNKIYENQKLDHSNNFSYILDISTKEQEISRMIHNRKIFKRNYVKELSWFRFFYEFIRIVGRHLYCLCRRYKF